MLHMMHIIIILKLAHSKINLPKPINSMWNGMGETLLGAQSLCQWVTLIDR
jgi:hypothetical protein